MNKQRKTTLKEKKLVKGIIAGKTRKQAAIEAGYAPKCADSQASQVLSKPNVQSEFQKALEKAGVTTARLAEKISEGLDSKKVISATIVAGNSQEAGSTTNDFIEVPDYLAQHKFLDTALKLKGAYPSEKVEVKHEHTFETRLKTIHEGSPELEEGDEEDIIEIERV